MLYGLLGCITHLQFRSSIENIRLSITFVMGTNIKVIVLTPSLSLSVSVLHSIFPSLFYWCTPYVMTKLSLFCWCTTFVMTKSIKNSRIIIYFPSFSKQPIIETWHTVVIVAVAMLQLQGWDLEKAKHVDGVERFKILKYSDKMGLMS